MLVDAIYVKIVDLPIAVKYNTKLIRRNEVDNTMVKVKQDLTGMIFGRLIVIEQGEDHICPNGKRIAQWRGKCNCGNQDRKLIRGSSITSGSTRS